MMKIMIVTPYFYPSVGGVQNYVLNIARGLSEYYNHEIIIVSSADRGIKTVSKEKFEGMVVYRLPFQFKLSNTPFNFSWKSQIKLVINAEKPDVINAHMPVPFMADMAIRAARNIPTALTYHNDLTKSNLSGRFMAKAFYGLLSSSTLRKATSIIATSQYYVDNSPYLQKWKSKINIVSPGVDSERFNQKVDKEWLKKKYPDKKIVLFVGIMDKTHAHKGMSVLLESIAQVKNKIPNIFLVAVGAGDAIPAYIELSRRLGIADMVDFTGFVSDKDLPRYYSGADVFVLPSTNESEGFGMVLAEAQSCGTPVIGTRVGGIPYVVDNSAAGVLIEPNSARQLSKAIIKIMAEAKFKGGLLSSEADHDSYKFSWKKETSAFNDIVSDLRSRKNEIIHISSYYPPYLVLAGNWKSKAGIYEVKNGLIVEFLRSFEFMGAPVFPALLIRLLRSSKNSIWHLHVGRAFTPEVTLLASKLKDHPYISHVRVDPIPSSKIGRLILAPYKKLILGPVLRHSSIIICLTEDYAKSMEINYSVNKKQIVVIPNATSFDIVKQTSVKMHKPIRIIHVSRLTNQKNIPLMINAIKSLVERGYNVQLRIIGEGPELDGLKSLTSSLDIVKNVKFLGRIEGRKLQSEYVGADAVAQVSLVEAFSTVLLEAMASGKPLIASDIEGTRSIVKDGYNGLLIDPYSLDSLVSALELLINDESLRVKLVKNGMTEILGYSWDRILLDTEKVYERMTR
jgi:glycosyltransferase involved in cell wall biosynthesis